MLGHVIRRLQRVRHCDRVVVIVPPHDIPILAPVVVRDGVQCLAPPVPEWDLAARHYWAAQFCRADIILRVPSDNPCIDPAAIEMMLDAWQHEGQLWDNLHQRQLWTNLQPVNGSGWPDGFGAEVYSLNILEKLHLEAEGQDREHPHLSLVRTGRVKTIPCPPEWCAPELRFDVDTAEDLARIRALFATLGPDFTLAAAIPVMRRLCEMQIDETP